jgi:hypothetical protein
MALEEWLKIPMKGGFPTYSIVAPLYHRKESIDEGILFVPVFEVTFFVPGLDFSLLINHASIRHRPQLLLMLWIREYV